LININQTFGDLWRLLEDNNVSSVIVDDLKPSSDPSHIEVYIHVTEDYLYKRPIRYIRAVLRLPDFMFRSKEFVDIIDMFCRIYFNLHFSMAYALSDWAQHLQERIKDFEDEMPPSKASGLMPINKVKETYTTVGRSCIKDASQKILRYPLFNLSFKKLYDVMAEKETITTT
jgi:hypothetical protein